VARPSDPVVPADRLVEVEQPTLQLAEPDGVVLRPWILADAPVVAAAFDDPDIQRWHSRRVASLAEAETWITATHAGWLDAAVAVWAIVDPSLGPGPVGRIALVLELAAGLGEISYWTLPAGRGRGLASRGADRVARYAFDELGLHRLLIQHSVHNPSSCSVAERAGFVAEGTARSAMRHADGWHDMHQHGRLATDPSR
jgi:RimJ/RimL family protein N-acetyltransferase